MCVPCVPFFFGGRGKVDTEIRGSLVPVSFKRSVPLAVRLTLEIMKHRVFFSSFRSYISGHFRLGGWGGSTMPYHALPYLFAG